MSDFEQTELQFCMGLIVWEEFNSDKLFNEYLFKPVYQSSLTVSLLPIIPKLPPVQQIVPGIIRILGTNPGYTTLQGTNSYLIGCGDQNKGRVLIDTSDSNHPNYIKNLLDVLLNTGPKAFIRDIILTHWHDDHVGAVKELVVSLKTMTGIVPNILKFPSKDKHDTINFPYQRLAHDNEIDVPGLGQLKVLHTPGHTDDHICLELPEQQYLFSGDLILGNGTTTLEYLNSYMKSLNQLHQKAENLRFILPGHGELITNPLAKTQEYIKHRIERISEVYRILKENIWTTEKQLLDSIYFDVAIQNVSSALANQRQALIYLEKQGLIKSSILEDLGDFETKYSANLKWKKILNVKDSLKMDFD